MEKDEARRPHKYNKNHKNNENSENEKSNKSAQKYLQTTSVSLLGKCTWMFLNKIFCCCNCVDLGIFVTFLVTKSGFVIFGTFRPFSLPWIAIFVLFRYIFSLLRYICGDPLIPLSTKTYFYADLLVLWFSSFFSTIVPWFVVFVIIVIFVILVILFFWFVILAIACISGHKCSSCMSSKSCKCAHSVALFSLTKNNNPQSIKLGYFKCNISLPVPTL